jgi:hypothetical protein
LYYVLISSDAETSNSGEIDDEKDNDGETSFSGEKSEGENDRDDVEKEIEMQKDFEADNYDIKKYFKDEYDCQSLDSSSAVTDVFF